MHTTNHILRFMLHKLRFVVLLSIVIAGGVLSCSELPTDTGLPTEDIAFEDVSIVPDRVVLSALGAQDSLLVHVVYNGGRSMTGAAAHWESSAPDVVSVHPTLGVITARENGLAVITAVLDADESVSAQAEVVVKQEVHSLVPVSDTIFTAPAGREVEVVAAAKDSRGHPVADVEVQFVLAEGDGTIAPTSTRTDSMGLARTVLTLGSSRNARHVVTARIGGNETQYVAQTTSLEIDFLTDTPDPAPVVGTTLRRVEVQVKDSEGRAQSNVPVFWDAVVGTIANADSVTNTQGIARVNWTLGSKSGVPHRLRARIGQDAEPRDTAELLVIPTPDKPAAIALVSQSRSSAPPEERVEIQVKVVDQYGNPVSGEELSWSVAASGGAFQEKTTVTNNEGVARNTWTLGTSYGMHRAEVRIANTDAYPLSLDVNVTHDIPTRVRFLTSPPDPAKTAGSTIERVEVMVTDNNGLRTPNVPVFWEAIDGSLSNADPRTNDDGIARVDWTLGTKAGVEQRLRARIGQGLEPRDTAVLAVVATHGTATSIVVAEQSHTSAPTGSEVSITARALDQYGNRVYGAPVQFAVRTGGGAVLTREVYTNTQGEASTTWRLGTVLGSQEVEAIVSGGLASTLFSVTATPGTPVRIEAVTPPVLADTVGRTVSPAPAVRVRDGGSNVVPNAEVVWIARGGSQANGLTSARSRTDSTGVATIPWTLGVEAGTDSLVASIDGDTVVFVAIANPDVAHTIRHISPSRRLDGVVGQQAVEPLIARVEDQYGNPVPNVIATWTGDGSVVALGKTDANGQVIGEWTFGITAGEQSVRPEVSGLTSVGEARASVSHGPAAAIHCPTGHAYCDQTIIDGVVGRQLSSPLTVTVVDQYGNPVQGATIIWSTKGGALSRQSSTTDASGMTSVSWTMPTTTTTATAIQTFAAVQGTGLTYSWDAYAHPDLDNYVLKFIEGTDAVGDTIGVDMPRLVVQLRDQYNNPLPDVQVSWLQESGSDLQPSVATSTTNSAGETSAAYNLGLKAGRWSAIAKVGAKSIEHEYVVSPGGLAGLEKVIDVVASDTIGSSHTLRVVSVDRGGNPLDEGFVRWFSQGNGSMSTDSTQVVTMSQGGVSTNWTFPEEIVVRRDLWTGEVTLGARKQISARAELYNNDYEPLDTVYFNAEVRSGNPVDIKILTSDLIECDLLLGCSHPDRAILVGQDSLLVEDSHITIQLVDRSGNPSRRPGSSFSWSIDGPIDQVVLKSSSGVTDDDGRVRIYFDARYYYNPEATITCYFGSTIKTPRYRLYELFNISYRPLPVSDVKHATYELDLDEYISCIA